MSQTELKNEDKINEFMNGLIKYIQDREKKDKSSFEKLEEQAERELELEQQQLKQKREDARKVFLLMDENEALKRQLDNIDTDIERWTERIKELEEKKSTERQTEKFSELIKKHKNTREKLLRKIDRKILEQELLPNETHNPDCDADTEGKNCPIMG
jgi:hypothetical protein